MSESYFIDVTKFNYAGESVCILCGESFFQNYAGFALMEVSSQTCLGDVCPTCVSSGSAVAASRVIDHAWSLIERAGSMHKLSKVVAMMDDWPALSKLNVAEAEALGDAIVANEAFGSGRSGHCPSCGASNWQREPCHPGCSTWSHWSVR